MKQDLTGARVLLVGENTQQVGHVFHLLETWGSHIDGPTVSLSTAIDQTANTSPDALLVVDVAAYIHDLVQIGEANGRAIVCICDDDDAKVAAVLAIGGCPVIQPWTPRQLQTALVYALGGAFAGQRIATELRQHEEALRASEERYRLIVRATSDLIWEWELASDSLDLSDAIYSTFGYSPDAIQYQRAWWLQQIHPEDAERVANSLQQAIAGEEELWSEEYRFRRGNGDYATVLDRGYVQRGSDGSPNRMIGSVYDMTRHLEAEQSLRQSELRLQQAQKMEAVGRLAGGIAHDFNNLLTVVGSYSELAKGQLAEGTPARRYVEQIRKASAAAASLTRQLLAFSRQQVLQPRVLDLNELVAEITHMAQSLLSEQVEFATRLEPELGKVEADPGQLQQVLLNLIVNAKDAMPTGGLLHIESRNVVVDASYVQRHPQAAPGAYVRLSVTDTGMGMDAATQARIFEPFFTTKPKGVGTGLGLAMVYGIVEQSGGHIHVYSEVGQGTVFHIYLPRVDKPAYTHTAEHEEMGLSQGKETVLVVEDEDQVRELTVTILSTAGYQVLAAASPTEAIDLCQTEERLIHLLLTDVVMPQMGGRELARHLVAARPAMHVLYMSGYTEDIMFYQGQLEASARYMQKPFYPTDLLATVRRTLDEPQLLYLAMSNS